MATPDLGEFGQRNTLTIIGLGNELLSDDGVGIRVVRELKKRLLGQEVTFEELSVGGLGLLDYIIGYDKCIIVDAVVTGTHPAGTVYRFIQTADSDPVTLSSSHQIDLAQVLRLAALLGADVPRRVTVYGIEASDVLTFNDGCTDEVTHAIPALVEAMYKDVMESGKSVVTRSGAWEIINDAIPV